MTDPLVPAATIRRLTCERERTAQLAELKRLRIPFQLNQKGEILVTAGVLDRWIAGNSEGGRVRARLEEVQA